MTFRQCRSVRMREVRSWWVPLPIARTMLRISSAVLIALFDVVSRDQVFTQPEVSLDGNRLVERVPTVETPPPGTEPLLGGGLPGVLVLPVPVQVTIQTGENDPPPGFGGVLSAETGPGASMDGSLPPVLQDPMYHGTPDTRFDMIRPMREPGISTVVFALTPNVAGRGVESVGPTQFTAAIAGATVDSDARTVLIDAAAILGPTQALPNSFQAVGDATAAGTVSPIYRDGGLTLVSRDQSNSLTGGNPPNAAWNPSAAILESGFSGFGKIDITESGYDQGPAEGRSLPGPADDFDTTEGSLPALTPGMAAPNAFDKAESGLIDFTCALPTRSAPSAPNPMPWCDTRGIFSEVTRNQFPTPMASSRWTASKAETGLSSWRRESMRPRCQTHTGTYAAMRFRSLALIPTC